MKEHNVSISTDADSTNKYTHLQSGQLSRPFHPSVRQSWVVRVQDFRFENIEPSGWTPPKSHSLAKMREEHLLQSVASLEECSLGNTEWSSVKKKRPHLHYQSDYQRNILSGHTSRLWALSIRSFPPRTHQWKYDANPDRKISHPVVPVSNFCGPYTRYAARPAEKACSKPSTS